MHTFLLIYVQVDIFASFDWESIARQLIGILFLGTLNDKVTWWKQNKTAISRNFGQRAILRSSIRLLLYFTHTVHLHRES